MLISVSLRPAWSTRASSRTGSKTTEKPCLEKTKKKHFQDLWPLARMKSLGVAVTLDIWSGNQLVTFLWSVLS